VSPRCRRRRHLPRRLRSRLTEPEAPRKKPNNDQGGQATKKDHEESFGRDIRPETQHMFGAFHATVVVADSSEATPARQLLQRWKGLPNTQRLQLLDPVLASG
jgi:hypothetical protein